VGQRDREVAGDGRAVGRFSSVFGPANVGIAPSNEIGVLFSASWFERDFLQAAFQGLRTYRFFLQLAVQVPRPAALRMHHFRSLAWSPKSQRGTRPRSLRRFATRQRFDTLRRGEAVPNLRRTKRLMQIRQIAKTLRLHRPMQCRESPFSAGGGTARC
jgi:hypothetical protein